MPVRYQRIGVENFFLLFLLFLSFIVPYLCGMQEQDYISASEAKRIKKLPRETWKAVAHKCGSNVSYVRQIVNREAKVRKGVALSIAEELRKHINA